MNSIIHTLTPTLRIRQVGAECEVVSELIIGEALLDIAAFDTRELELLVVPNAIIIRPKNSETQAHEDSRS